MKPYLIQRARFRNDKNLSKKGIDTILEFDYMGSAEFEFGALPASLKRIRSFISDYSFHEIVLNGKKIYVFCDKGRCKEVDEIIAGLAENKYRLKEYCDLNHYIFNGGTSGCNNDFWWDIKNDYMFWKDNEEFNDAFDILIHNK